MKRLVLFDIDGTLLSVHGAGGRAMLAAVEEVFACRIALDGYSMSGKTDTQIVLELLARSGGVPDDAFARLGFVWERHCRILAETLPSHPVTVFPGVSALLDRLASRTDAVVGLLTGNVERAAHLKLQRVGLAHHFLFGAYGDRASERCELPALAVEQARVRTGHSFSGKDIVIVGDTPNDIDCGRHLGVRALAVATGNFSRAALAACAPDHLFDDLSATDRVLESIFA